MKWTKKEAGHYVSGDYEIQRATVMAGGWGGWYPWLVFFRGKQVDSCRTMVAAKTAVLRQASKQLMHEHVQQVKGHKIMATKKTANRERVLRLAARNGRVWAGRASNEWDKGAVVGVHASTIRSLIGVGLLTQVSDDGLAAEMTDKGRAVLAELDAALDNFRST